MGQQHLEIARLARASDPSSPRRGAVLVLAAVLLVVIFAFAAFSIDLGYVSLISTELQNAADASALSAIQRLPDGQAVAVDEAMTTARANSAAGREVVLTPAQVEFGQFELATRTFQPDDKHPNAVRVTAAIDDQPYFFAPIIGHQQFAVKRSAIATLRPRDIVFCVDLSGSMNDDTEPAWATSAINSKLKPSGFGAIGEQLMQQVYSDFGYGSFPGTVQHVGSGLANVPQTSLAYAVMTQDDGPLSASAIPAKYRIELSDTELVRKSKAYQWMMDFQLKVLMPAAQPPINSSDSQSVLYWGKYLDYVLQPVSVGSNPPANNGGGSGGSSGGSSGGGNNGGGNGGGGNPAPPAPKPPSGFIDISAWWNPVRPDRPRVLGQWASNTPLSAASFLGMATVGANLTGVPRRGATTVVSLPPSQDGDRITGFNNPNTSTFPGAKSSLVTAWRNKLGYLTYVQFMMDFGRDRSPGLANSNNANPNNGVKTPLSVLSPYCPYHAEDTAGGTFQFPPSEQPTHALRRALIAAIHEVKQRNLQTAPAIADRVSIVTFDAISAYHAPRIVLPLTNDYDSAMLACTTLQAVGDLGNSTATEYGIKLARQHLQPATSGGAGRNFADKVLVLLTDGVPNVWESSADDLDAYITQNGSDDWYGPNYPWYNSALVQTAQFAGERHRLFPVAVGLGADYDFMDRMSRTARTADSAGQSPRGSGNPAEYEQQLLRIFQDIISRVNGKLVK